MCDDLICRVAPPSIRSTARTHVELDKGTLISDRISIRKGRWDWFGIGILNSYIRDCKDKRVLNSVDVYKFQRFLFRRLNQRIIRIFPFDKQFKYLALQVHNSILSCSHHIEILLRSNQQAISNAQYQVLLDGLDKTIWAGAELSDAAK